MPWQIHWIVGNADLRFHVIYPKIYKSQQTGHPHIVGHCQSKGLWECHALKTSLSAVRQLCWHCSGWVEDVEERSSLSRSCPTTRWSTPSSMEMSVAHIYHGHNDVGVGVRGAARFWLWNWVQASHWWTTSLMALFMPGQKKLPCASNCDFVIP